MVTTIICQLIFTLVGLAAAQDAFVATFVMSKGDVKILRPAEAGTGGKLLVFEGRKYSFEDGRIGKKVKPSDVLQTGTDGRAKIIFSNGDQFQLGPGTSMSLPSLDGEEKGSGQNLELFYGRIRALISKGGPRSGLKARTPSATAGVRGTDFFLRHNPTIGSEIIVIRGAIELKDKKTTKPPLNIKKGYWGLVGKTVKVDLAKKNDLIAVQNETALNLNDANLADLPKADQETIEALNQTATKAILTDIQSEDPKQHDRIVAQLKASADGYQINTAVLAELVQQAPGLADKKPTAEELEAQGADIYEKYFKPAK